MPYTLKYDGTTQSLEAWGIIDPRIERVSLDVEKLTFAVRGADIYDDPAFDFDETIELFRDGVRIFMGTVSAQPAYGGEAERQRYVVSNAWRKLEEIIYQQAYALSNEDYTGLIGSWSTRVVLGQNQFGVKLTASQQIERVSAYANTVGAGLFVLAELATTAEVPLETVRDITCAEAIRRMVGYTPDAVGYFDYTSTPPTLHIKRRSALSTVNLDLTPGVSKIETIDGLQSRPDLVPNGVLIIYIKNSVDEADTSGRSRPHETRDSAGTTTGPRVITATVELGENGTEGGEAVPTGLAEQYYVALRGAPVGDPAVPPWEGSIVLAEQECTGSVLPGSKINLLNGRTAWASMAAIVQQTEEDLLTGRTTVTFGLPEHLGLSNFVDYMARWRQRSPSGGFPATQHNGTAGVDSYLAGSEPATGIGEDPAAGGGQGGDPDTDPEEQEGNENGGAAALPGVYSYINVKYCDITVPSAPVTRYARVVGTPISTP